MTKMEDRNAYDIDNDKAAVADGGDRTVAVLLSTYNGERFLSEQLESLLNQRGISILVCARDDGSTDGTQAILDAYSRTGRVIWSQGENLGPAWSFMELIYSAPVAPYYAFCDQDDVWLDDKLAIAVKRLESADLLGPALYYGRPRLVDENLSPIPGTVRSTERSLDFAGSLIRSNATGCTMVFNKALLNLVQAERPDYIAMHDGWIHRVCTALGGTILYDDDVHILYRQHGGNVIGGTSTITERFRHHIDSLVHPVRIRSRMAITLEECYADEMDSKNLEKVRKVAHYRDSLGNRLALLQDASISTPYKRVNRLYRMAVALGVF